LKDQDTLCIRQRRSRNDNRRPESSSFDADADADGLSGEQRRASHSISCLNIPVVPDGSLNAKTTTLGKPHRAHIWPLWSSSYPDRIELIERLGSSSLLPGFVDNESAQFSFRLPCERESAKKEKS